LIIKPKLTKSLEAYANCTIRNGRYYRAFGGTYEGKNYKPLEPDCK
jgi:hypothetical protein